MVPVLRWRRAAVRMAGLLLVALTLAACDKCNNMFRFESGPLACKDERPKN